MFYLNILALCGISLIIAVILKEYNPQFLIFVPIILTVIIFFEVAPYIKEIAGVIYEMVQILNSSNFYIEEIGKMIGIAYLSEISIAICKDAGQNAIGQKIEIVSKIAVLYIGLPIISELLNIILNISMWR
ncbi:MAG: SpoIIIAC/SpoIIIAD family protein [Lachnospirales bacterium]